MITGALLAFAGSTGLTGCTGRRSPRQDETAESETRTAARRAAAEVITAGASCRGREDCARDQSCVAGICTHRRTCARGEVLAEAARGMLERGDERGAVDAFEQSMEAFRSRDAPVPPDVLCDAADAALQVQGSDDAKERGARWADHCLRGSLPGSEARRRVTGRLARLRHSGLDLAAFDEDPARSGAFYTAEAQTPPVDAIEIELRLGTGDQAGFAQTRRVLESDAARRAIAACFGEVWSQAHARHLEAAVLLQMNTRLRDVGDAQIYIGRVRVRPSATDAFSSCTATALDTVLDSGMRLSRSAIWQEPLVIAARLD